MLNSGLIILVFVLINNLFVFSCVLCGFELVKLKEVVIFI